jgi:hypothetical protein
MLSQLGITGNPVNLYCHNGDSLKFIRSIQLSALLKHTTLLTVVRSKANSLQHSWYLTQRTLQLNKSFDTEVALDQTVIG